MSPEELDVFVLRASDVCSVENVARATELLVDMDPTVVLDILSRLSRSVTQPDRRVCLLYVMSDWLHNLNAKQCYQVHGEFGRIIDCFNLALLDQGADNIPKQLAELVNIWRAHEIFPESLLSRLPIGEDVRRIVALQVGSSSNDAEGDMSEALTDFYNNLEWKGPEFYEISHQNESAKSKYTYEGFTKEFFREFADILDPLQSRHDHPTYEYHAVPPPETYD